MLWENKKNDVTGSYIQKNFQYKCMQNILLSGGKESN
jgi:hypothetical protein